MSDGFTLSQLRSMEWDSAGKLHELFSDAEDCLTKRRLLLFRASCCVPLLQELGEFDCSSVVQNLEHFAQSRVNVKQQSNALLAIRNRFGHHNFRAEYDKDWREKFQRAPDDEIHVFKRALAHVNALGLIEHASIHYSYRTREDELRHTKLFVSNLFAFVLQRHGNLLRLWSDGNLTGEAAQFREESVRILCEEESRLCHLLRAIVPNPHTDWSFLEPFRANPSVMDQTRLIDQSLDYSMLPNLCDALLNAGCGDSSVLLHCIRENPSIRGSWLIDLLLNKPSEISDY